MMSGQIARTSGTRITFFTPNRLASLRDRDHGHALRRRSIERDDTDRLPAQSRISLLGDAREEPVKVQVQNLHLFGPTHEPP